MYSFSSRLADLPHPRPQLRQPRPDRDAEHRRGQRSVRAPRHHQHAHPGRLGARNALGHRRLAARAGRPGSPRRTVSAPASRSAWNRSRSSAKCPTVIRPSPPHSCGWSGTRPSLKKPLSGWASAGRPARGRGRCAVERDHEEADNERVLPNPVDLARAAAARTGRVTGGPPRGRPDRW